MDRIYREFTIAFGENTGIPPMTPEVDAFGFVRAKAIGCRAGGFRVYGQDEQSWEYISPEELTLAAKKKKQMLATLGHPTRMTTAATATADRLAVGSFGGLEIDDDGNLLGDLLLFDAIAIAALGSGVQQLSVGFTCLANPTDRQWVDTKGLYGVEGQGYSMDRDLTDIDFNHIALVSLGIAKNARVLEDRCYNADNTSRGISMPEENVNELLRTNERLLGEAAGHKQQIDKLKAVVAEYESRDFAAEVAAAAANEAGQRTRLYSLGVKLGVQKLDVSLGSDALAMSIATQLGLDTTGKSPDYIEGMLSTLGTGKNSQEDIQGIDTTVTMGESFENANQTPKSRLDIIKQRQRRATELRVI